MLSWLCFLGFVEVSVSISSQELVLLSVDACFGGFVEAHSGLRDDFRRSSARALPPVFARSASAVCTGCARRN